MILFKKKGDIQQFIANQRQKGHKIGFVPTMGALHPGHVSLINAANNKTAVTVCSIFVNPTQFNNKKDLEKYPRIIEKDLEMLMANNCTAVFFPEVDEMYPEGTDKTASFDLGELEFILEGKFRPGHFQGVADVVSRLFYMVTPDEVFFGQKDLQQTKIIERLIANNQDFRNIKMNIVPTLREDSMLAMSSRNMRLTKEQLELAPSIYEQLSFLKDNIAKGDLNPLIGKATEALIAKGFKPDYIAIVNKETMEEVTDWDGHTPLTALVAAYLGDIRLIDNLDITNNPD